MENLYTQIAEDFKISEEFCLQYYMMKWNDWVRLKNIDVVKHGGKLNVIFSQNSPRKEHQIRNKKATNLSNKYLPKQNSTVKISPRSKLHASIDRIKRLSVPSCENDSLASRNQVQKLTASQCGSANLSSERLSVLPATKSPSTSSHHSELSLQQEPKSALFSESHPQQICDLSIVKSEPGIAPYELKTAHSLSSGQFTNTINNMSMMGLPCKNRDSVVQTLLYPPDAHSKSTHLHYGSVFPAKMADYCVFPDDSYFSKFNIPQNYSKVPQHYCSAPAESSYSFKTLPSKPSRTSSTGNRTSTESMASWSPAIPDFENVLMANSDVKSVTENKHSSIQHEIQQHQEMVRQKGTSTYSTSQLDMYEIPECEIAWDVREKLYRGDQLSDSERTRVMDAIYNHVTKFTFYPSAQQYNLIVNNFLIKYPTATLGEGANPMDAAELWKKRLKRKFQNLRARRDFRVPCVQRQKIGKRATKCFLMTSSPSTSSWHYPQTESSDDNTQHTEHSEDRKPYQQQ